MKRWSTIQLFEDMLKIIAGTITNYILLRSGCHCRVHRTWYHGILVGWILYFFSHLADERGQAITDVTKVKASLRETRSRVGYRLQGCRQPSFNEDDMSRQIRQIIPVIREYLQEKNWLRDKNKPTRPVFHIL